MNRPYIKKIHIILLIASIMISLAALILGFVYALTSDGPVPMHFDLQGNVNGYGSPWGIVIMPAVSVVMVITMGAVMLLVPADSWNIGIGHLRYTRKNLVYAECALMIALMALEFALFSLAFTICIMSSHPGLIAGAGATLVIAMTATVIIYFVRANRANRL